MVWCPAVQDQLATCTSQYVEEALGQHFGDLVRFVKAAEAAAKQVPQPASVSPLPRTAHARAVVAGHDKAVLLCT